MCHRRSRNCTIKRFFSGRTQRAEWEICLGILPVSRVGKVIKIVAMKLDDFCKAERLLPEEQYTVSTPVHGHGARVTKAVIFWMENKSAAVCVLHRFTGGI